MAARKPIVIGADGLPQQLQAGDTISGPHAFFTGSANLPAITLLIGNGTSTFAVTPRVTGDVLVAGEPIVVSPGVALPAGLNIAYAIVTGQNTVQIAFSAAVAITVSSVAWTVVALR
ncbi:hypothetical protein [Methylobacterium komagatae]